MGRELGSVVPIACAGESEDPRACMSSADEAPGAEPDAIVPRNGNLDPFSDVRAVRTMSPQILHEHNGHMMSSKSLLLKSEVMQHFHAYTPIQPMWK